MHPMRPLRANAITARLPAPPTLSVTPMIGVLLALTIGIIGASMGTSAPRLAHEGRPCDMCRPPRRPSVWIVVGRDQVFVEEQALGPDDLLAAADKASEGNRTVPVMIAAGPDVPYGTVIETAFSLQRAGYSAVDVVNLEY